MIFMQKTINITYRYGSQLKESADYQYDMQLSDSDESKRNYFIGKQRDNQMDALALALKSSLPDTAIIKQINHVDFTATKASILDMLQRKDDYLATILFETDDEPAQVDTKTNTETDQKIAKTEKSQVASTSPRLLECQLGKSHSYQEIDLNETEPAATDKVRKIGMSKLSYVCNYKDLKHVLSTKKVDVFNTPLGMVPSNGKVTEARKRTFSNNAGLDTNALDNAKDILVGVVKNTNNGKEYNMYAFAPNAAQAANASAKTQPVQEAQASPAANEPQAAQEAATAPVTANADTATGKIQSESTAEIKPSTKPAAKETVPSSLTDNNAPITNAATSSVTKSDAANTLDNQSQATNGQYNPLTGNEKPAAADLFRDYVPDPFKMENNQQVSTEVQVPKDEDLQVPKAFSKPETVQPTNNEPVNDNNETLQLSAIRDQLAELSSKLDTLLMNSNDSTSATQFNNNLMVNLNAIKQQLNTLLNRTANANNLDTTEITTKLDKILTNQANSKPHEPDTLNELILQESNLTDADMKQIPERIRKYCFDHNEALPMERANFIFQIITYLKDTLNIPEDLKCLSDPELFLKVVHLLSWFN